MTTAFDVRLTDAVHAAERVFAEYGYAAATMRDVAEAAGLSIAGLYYYLPSKEHALFLVCRRAFLELSKALDAAMNASGSHEERLHAFVRGHIEFLAREPHAYRVLLYDLDALKGEHRTQIRELRRTYFTRAADLVIAVQQERHSTIPTHVATAALFGMMNWMPMWHRDGTDGARHIAGDMSRLFIQGVAA
ncbi:MAG TPA: TetR/AcrR family transcriptional regulator [Candidatus Baltobacteraceae bacterium]|nr:TetR/AcrR family transcriptional regulator [Candidatus Baltobacteraceae bacterium]